MIGRCCHVLRACGWTLFAIGVAGNPARAQSPSPGLPPPSPPVEVPVNAEEAVGLVQALFGCSVAEYEENERSFRVRVEKCSLPCPLDRVRDTRCGQFDWRPDEMVIFRTSFTASVSGHLARNRVVVVDLRSSTAGLARGTLHGVLVFPTANAAPGSRPAFAWYLTRLGRSLSLDLMDVNADGALDLVYTYESYQVGGVHLVSRDVWTATDLQVDRLIASGDALTGIAVGAYDGVPLHRDRDEGFERGAWRFETLDPSRPFLVLVERASFPGVAGPDWEFLVISDLGEGWTEVLSGGTPAAGDDHVFADGLPTGTCSPADLPAGLSLSLRERLLRLERACREVREASQPRSEHPLLEAIRWLLAAWRAASTGMRVIALGLESAAATSLWKVAAAQSGSKSGASSMSALYAVAATVLSAHVAWATHREKVRAYDTRFTAPPEWSGFEALPALHPWVGIVWATARVTTRWAGHFAGSAVFGQGPAATTGKLEPSGPERRDRD